MNSNTPSPNDDDKQLNPLGKPPLSEKDFIQNGWTWKSIPFWIWLSLIASLMMLIMGSDSWYNRFINQEKKHEPFLEVNNRDFSVFLWQFPSFLRIHSSKKAGYLSGFLATSENFDPEAAEEFVSAPPDLIFLYHTWKRLVGNQWVSRPIRPTEFEDFLQQLPEWLPKNWKDAPVEYVQMIESKEYLKSDNLQNLPETSLPILVRKAFIGWKNYFLEGVRINEITPTYSQVKQFLDQYPGYARHFWRNIGEINGQQVAGINYLRPFLDPTFDPETIIPNDELAPFLKVALFNAEQSKKDQ